MAKKVNKIKIALYLGIILLLGLSVFYVSQTMELAELSFTMGEYQDKIQKEKNEVTYLKMSFEKSDNLASLEEKLALMGYQKIKKIEYITFSEGTFAKSNQTNQ